MTRGEGGGMRNGRHHGAGSSQMSAITSISPAAATGNGGHPARGGATAQPQPLGRARAYAVAPVATGLWVEHIVLAETQRPTGARPTAVVAIGRGSCVGRRGSGHGGRAARPGSAPCRIHLAQLASSYRPDEGRRGPPASAVAQAPPLAGMSAGNADGDAGLPRRPFRHIAGALAGARQRLGRAGGDAGDRTKRTIV